MSRENCVACMQDDGLGFYVIAEFVITTYKMSAAICLICLALVVKKGQNYYLTYSRLVNCEILCTPHENSSLTQDFRPLVCYWSHVMGGVINLQTCKYFLAISRSSSRFLKCKTPHKHRNYENIVGKKCKTRLSFALRLMQQNREQCQGDDVFAVMLRCKWRQLCIIAALVTAAAAAAGHSKSGIVAEQIFVYVQSFFVESVS